MLKYTDGYRTVRIGYFRSRSQLQEDIEYEEEQNERLRLQNADLLAACKAMLRQDADDFQGDQIAAYFEAISMMRAAVAKAEGQS